ncbi:energy transducer TonB family protein [Acinetobacter sp. GSS19]|uniref:energy transducer TonB family protein n=1 Tax=Acinetobacter sp. GSS19 TaxID=3020716 RepID=UPI0023624192|nr:energy transducer TonB [Acinetobacter sp. GSS19]
MSSSSALSPQPPHPMKKKIIAALVSVVVGHLGVLWAVSQIKTAELKKIEKQPLQVRFVKIQQQPKPAEPEPQPEPKKAEPPKPVKEVKVVEKPVVSPPKKVEKIQQVKQAETAKPVVKPVQTPAKPVVAPVVTETKVVKPVPVPPPAAKPVAPPAPPIPAGPKSVSIGGSGVQWSRTPRPSYSNKDLQGESRRVVVLIEANEQGNITNARITRSSGLAALDEKILRAVRNAKFKPYKENGVAYPIRAEQPFELTLNPNG